MENKNLAEKTQEILQEILQYTQGFLTQNPSQIEIDIVKDKTKLLYETLLSYNTIEIKETITETPQAIVVEEEISIETAPIIEAPIQVEVVEEDILPVIEPIIEEPIVEETPEIVIDPIITEIPEIATIETPIEEIPQIIIEEPVIEFQNIEEETPETLISFDILNSEEPKIEIIEPVIESIQEPIIVEQIIEEIPEPIVQETIIEVAPEAIIPEEKIEITPEAVVINTPIVEPIATIQEEVINEPVAEEISSSESDIDINKLQSILQLKNNKDLSSKLGKKPLTNISSAIGINDRFRYIKEMFNNDIAQYNNAIQTINSSTDLDNALRYIVSNFDWDYENNLVQSFIILVERRFL